MQFKKFLRETINWEIKKKTKNATVSQRQLPVFVLKIHCSKNFEKLLKKTHSCGVIQFNGNHWKNLDSVKEFIKVKSDLKSGSDLFDFFTQSIKVGISPF